MVHQRPHLAANSPLIPDLQDFRRNIFRELGHRFHVHGHSDSDPMPTDLEPGILRYGRREGRVCFVCLYA